MFTTVQDEQISVLLINYLVLDTHLNHAIDILKTISPDLKVLLLYPHKEDYLVQHVLNSGLHGYLSFHAPLADATAAISSSLQLGKHFSKSLLRNKKIPVGLPLNRDFLISLLSPKEKEILKHLLNGKETNAIAKILNIKRSTVYTYKFRIFTKFGVSNLVQLTEIIKIR